MTNAQIAAVARSQGMTDLAGLLEMGGPVADQLGDAIRNAVAKKKAAKAAAAPPLVARQSYTDSQIVDMTIDEAVRLVTSNEAQTEEQLTNVLTAYVRALKAA